MKKNILGLESSQQNCSLALLFAGNIFEYTASDEQRSSQILLPTIQQLLKTAQCTLSDIDAIAFSKGPGSFTGLRVGAAVAQALAYAGKLPILPVSSLRVLAQQAFTEQEQLNTVLVCIDARMDGVYWGAFSRDNKNFAQSLQEDALSLAPYYEISLFLQKNDVQVIIGSASNLIAEKFIENTDSAVAQKEQDKKSAVALLEYNAPAASALISLASEFAQPIEAKDIEVAYLRGASAWKTLAEQAKGKK